MADTNATIDAISDTVAKTVDAAPSTLDKLTGTTADERADFLAKAQETLSDAFATAVDAVKSNPKTTAAIAAGATAAVAGAAYGATKLTKAAKAPAKPRATAAKPRATTKRAPAKRAPAAKK